ncbi:MAG TPA: hypothetical protein VGC60_00365 [Pyrinomonadaceae bacterium]|jgi:hypothetical protein
MNLVRRSWLVILLTLFVGGTGVAQSRIQLAQGRRAIQDKVSFVIDVGHDKSGNPRYADAPEDMRIMVRFADRPASGRVYLDGKAVGRFDETQLFTSNSIDVSYGRHTITLDVTAPATLSDVTVDFRGGIAHEILSDEEPAVTLAPDLSKRVAELERKVHDLEAEIAGLNKKRNH